jgi:hypothetical protein
MNSIANLREAIDNLPEKHKTLFWRILNVDIKTGKLSLPEEIRDRTEKKFGCSVEEQRIVRVTNKITLEGTLFNELRSLRPIDIKAKDRLDRIIEKTIGDPFCNPTTQTPADIFGRIEGKHCITASNIAKYDYLHSLIIFKDHNPFIFEKEKMVDYIDTALKWYKKAHEHDEKAIFPFFMWNCLWKAGASIVHGHAQLLLAKQPYAKAEYMRRVVKAYEERYASSYFDDIFTIHKSLGLGFEINGVKIMANLTPIKEKEVVMISKSSEKLPFCLSRVLACYYRLGVRSFTLAMFMPPLVEVDEWRDFPFIVRLVDRGDPMSKTADIGAMELYAGHSVVASDPFRVVDELKRDFRNYV